MTLPHLESDANRSTNRWSWLDRPIPGRWCVLSWLISSALFVGLIRLLGGPSPIDSLESVYSTYAIAHGQLSCAYPSHDYFGITLVSPLWPLLSGGIEALTRIGHNVPFPSQAALGPHCSTGVVAMYRWSLRADAFLRVVGIGYVCWLVLMAGMVALLRASGRGRCGWEPATLILLACAPAVWMPLVEYFHPQDIVAMGLGIAGLACARRNQWVWAGVFLGLAITSQQFALLILAPLLVLAPGRQRGRFVVAAVIAAAVIDVPMIVATSGRAFRPAVLGTGYSGLRQVGGTLVWEAHLHGALLVVFSRVLPIILSAVLAWWAVRKFGPAVMEPVPLISLIAVSLSFRLIFEVNLFGYYFMALAVSLIALDVARGQIRGELVAWLALIALAFIPAPANIALRRDLPLCLMTIALLLIASDIVRGHIRWYLVAWFIVVALTFGHIPPWVTLPSRHTMPRWVLQIALTTVGVALAAGPLLSAARSHEELQSEQPLDPDLLPSGEQIEPSL